MRNSVYIGTLALIALLAISTNTYAYYLEYTPATNTSGAPTDYILPSSVYAYNDYVVDNYTWYDSYNETFDAYSYALFQYGVSTDEGASWYGSLENSFTIKDYVQGVDPDITGNLCAAAAGEVIRTEDDGDYEGSMWSDARLYIGNNQEEAESSAYISGSDISDGMYDSAQLYDIDMSYNNAAGHWYCIERTEVEITYTSGYITALEAHADIDVVFWIVEN
jgi:hypothetical protein